MAFTYRDMGRMHFASVFSVFSVMAELLLLLFVLLCRNLKDYDAQV